MKLFTAITAATALCLSPLLSVTPAEAFISQRASCKNALKAQLKNRSSLKIPFGGIVEGNDVVRIDYSATNGFGARIDDQFYCEFDGKTLLLTVNN